MNTKTCLNDQDLLLYFYGELSEDTATEHLDSCQECKERLAALQSDLAKLPTPPCEPDDLAGTRMAARVTERIKQPGKRRWVPAIGATAAAALVLVITLTGSPPPEVQQVTKVQPTSVTTIDLNDDMPDIEFLEDLELLQELELLAKIEGV